MIHHINKTDDKDHVIISIDAENTFDKIQHSLMIEGLYRVVTNGAYLNTGKAMYDKPTALTSYSTVESTPARLGLRQGWPCSALFFNIVLKVQLDKRKR